MKFKSRIAMLAVAFTFSGCTAMVRTEAVPQSAAKSVPTERLRAFQENHLNYALVTVTRDAGFMGGGCYIGLVVSGILAARFDPEETARFFIPAGKSEMAVVRDPEGQGLCSVGAWDPVPEHYELKQDGQNLFRISLGAYRRPRLLPAVDQRGQRQ